MQALHDAIPDALFNGGVLPEETIERLLGDPADGDQADARSKLEELIQQIIERMADEGYITPPPDLHAERERRQGQVGPGQGRDGQGQVTFEVTDKTLDFLGYRALRDLLGSLGKSSYGRHDTREQATASRPPARRRPMNSATPSTSIRRARLNAVQRERGANSQQRSRLNAQGSTLNAQGSTPSRRIHVRHQDLMVVQGEHCSCATVLMLDCSHSMILYGEDRFTPAKRVALALAQLIKTQYPRRAEGGPVPRLGGGDPARRARTGPPPTHEHPRGAAPVAADSRPAAQGHAADHHDHRRQAVGADPARRAHYKNAFGLDPFIVAETCAEVAACRKSGIMINTFMLARDYDLVSLQACRRHLQGQSLLTTLPSAITS